MPIEWFLAVRFLREGRVQSALIIAGASFGVLLVVFLSALMAGLQVNLLDKTLGAQPHVLLRIPDESARPLRPSGLADPSGPLVATRIERPVQRVRGITDWRSLLAELDRVDGVTAVSPIATGAAWATRGGARNAVTLIGIEPERFRSVYDLDRRLLQGRYEVASDKVLIGRDLAADLGVSVGDRLLLEGEAGREQVCTVGAVFDFGVREVNRRWVVLALRSAQTLLDLPGGVSRFELRVGDVFLAGGMGLRLSGRTGLAAETWIDNNAELLAGLSAQASSSRVIQLFVILGLAVALASVLVISVVQKQRQIGILRAMGMSRARTLRIFLLQGMLVGVLGAVIGSGLGAAMVRIFSATGAFTFPVPLQPALFLRAGLVAVGTGLVSAVLPARSAARLPPAVAIRGE